MTGNHATVFVLPPGLLAMRVPVPAPVLVVVSNSIVGVPADLPTTFKAWPALPEMNTPAKLTNPLAAETLSVLPVEGAFIVILPEPFI